MTICQASSYWQMWPDYRFFADLPIRPAIDTEFNATRNQKMDIVFIRQLQIDTIIGVYEWEKTIMQRLEIDLELATDIRQAAAQDDIRLTLDYAVIATRVQQLICAEPIELIETVAEKIATMLLEQFATTAVRVSVCKPAAVANARTVGVQISRGCWA